MGLNINSKVEKYKNITKMKKYTRKSHQAAYAMAI